MPQAPKPIPVDRALTRSNFNTLVDAANRVYKASGGSGVAVEGGPDGLVIRGATRTVTLQEPAQTVLAQNVGATDLNVLDACQITMPIQLQAETDESLVLDGSPIDLPYLYEQRVLEVHYPTETSFGRFGICAEPLKAAAGATPGEIGNIWIAGVCLCKITRTGEWDGAQVWKTADRADLRQDQGALQLCTLGAAQVLYVWRPLWPSDATSARLAIIRFDSRNTAAVGQEEALRAINHGEAGVLNFPTATVSRIREGIVELSP